MDLSWKQPQNDGGSPITGYIIEAKERESEFWSELGTINHKDLNFTAARLKLGKFYSYRVFATNSYGTSDPVETEEFEAKYPFTVPDAPINCMISDVTAKKCSITFGAPFFDGGSPITGYFVERRDTSTNKWFRLNRELMPQLNFECNDLIEGTEYEFRITAENLAGTGLPSQPCHPFTAKNPYDKPSPPIKVKYGTVTKSSIELSWDEPLSNGGSPILGYEIEKRNAKTLYWSRLSNIGTINSLFTVVTNLKEGAEYDFRVIAFNVAGDSDPSSPTGLIITKNVILGDKPTLLQPLQDLRVIVGDTARFVAKIKTDLMPNIRWTVNDRIVGYEHVSTYINNTLDLTLNNVQLKDEGTYKVTVKNAIGELTLDAKLIVLKAPAIKCDARFDRTIEVVSQENLNISCEVNGFPKPSVKWFKERQEIFEDDESSRVTLSHGEFIERLDLEMIRRDEGGKYTVKAENEVGTAELTFIVKVLDVPMPPQNLKVANISSTSCKLVWQAPHDDGNVPITGYYIEKYNPKYGQFIRLDRTSINEYFVEHLQRNQSYRFRVLAENKVGLSEPCELKDPVLIKGEFDVPGMPQIPIVSEITEKSCRISWEAPLSDGGSPIKGYFIERKSATRWLRLNQDPEIRKFMKIKDLIQGMDYEFRVCAVNSEGEGPFSKPSDSFTTKDKHIESDMLIYADVRDITKSSCIVTWSPPTKPGGLPIVKYHIEIRVKGESKFVRLTDDFTRTDSCETEQNLRKLTDNQEYEFRIVAENEKGETLLSSPASMIKTHFISATEYKVTGLVENQEYEFRVCAENQKGEVLPSEPSRLFKARDKIVGISPEVSMEPEFGSLIGTQGKIQAIVSGTPTPNIVWKKGSRQLSLNSSKYSISFAQSLAVLYISNLSEEDAGQYTIEVDNCEGSDGRSCRLIVYAPPIIEYDIKFNKTTDVIAGSSFRFACQITGFPHPQVVWFKEDSALYLDQKIKIDNPTETLYYFAIKQCDRNDSGNYAIKASNQHGSEEARFSLNVVDRPDKPRGPIDITLESSQGTSVTLEWLPPKWDGGSDLIGYTIEYAKTSEEKLTKSSRNHYLKKNIVSIK